MSLASQVALLATRAANECKAIRAWATSTFQPVDTDLTAIAALTTSSYGRGLLTVIDSPDFYGLVANLGGNLLAGATSDMWLNESQSPSALPSVLTLERRGSVRAASTANLNLAADVTTVDGISLANKDYFLAKNQTTLAQNGVYRRVSGSAPARYGASGTAAQQRDYIASLGPVTVREGTQGGTQWVTSFKSTDTIGTANMVWVQSFGPIGSWTPTVTSETGAFNGTATATAVGDYQEINGYILYAVTITISAGTLGTAANGLRFSTPTGYDISSATTNMGQARERQVTGFSGSCTRAGSTIGQIYRYDAASLIAASRTVDIQGFYKKA